MIGGACEGAAAKDKFDNLPIAFLAELEQGVEDAL